MLRVLLRQWLPQHIVEHGMVQCVTDAWCQVAPWVVKRVLWRSVQAWQRQRPDLQHVIEGGIMGPPARIASSAPVSKDGVFDQTTGSRDPVAQADGAVCRQVRTAVGTHWSPRLCLERGLLAPAIVDGQWPQSHECERCMAFGSACLLRSKVGTGIACAVGCPWSGGYQHGGRNHSTRLKLVQSDKLVEGVAMRFSSAGSAVGGEDTARRVAKPNKPAPRAVRKGVVAKLDCDFRGGTEQQWPCPSARRSCLRDLPLPVCSASAATRHGPSGVGFETPRGAASAKGKSAPARLAKRLALAVAQRLATGARRRGLERAADAARGGERGTAPSAARAPSLCLGAACAIEPLRFRLGRRTLNGRRGGLWNPTGGRAGEDGRALCGVTQENVEFFREASTTRATFVTGADACREECETGRHCVAWTWGASVGCLLKAGGEPQLGGGPPARGLLQLPAVPRPGVVSGVSCAASEHSTGIRWSIDGVAAGREPGPVVSAGRELRRELIVDPGVTRPTSTSRPANATDANAPAAAANGTSATTATTSTTSTRTTTFPPGSLLCFSLMVPNSYEQDLLLMQHYIGASIFGCEEAAIYSNMVINLAPGLQTRFVDSDLHCNSGGEFQTALNTEIFLAVWKKLLSDQRYALHDWTVKVDPDCVFLPSLLRHMLR
ncbi:unnamed protein product, partial [Prorocentrum cordatum]